MSPNRPTATEPSPATVLAGIVDRLASTDREKEVLGAVLRLPELEANESLNHAPAPPPPASIDYLTPASAAVERYQAMVDAWPDDDPWPLEERRRALDEARAAVARLSSEGTP